MSKRTTVDQALKEIGITKPRLLEIERQWGLAFGAELPIPRDGRGHRQFSPAVILWLKHLTLELKAGASLLEAKFAAAGHQPAAAPRPSASGRSAALAIEY